MFFPPVFSMQACDLHLAWGTDFAGRVFIVNSRDIGFGWFSEAWYSKQQKQPFWLGRKTYDWVRFKTFPSWQSNDSYYACSGSEELCTAGLDLEIKNQTNIFQYRVRHLAFTVLSKLCKPLTPAEIQLDRFNTAFLTTATNDRWK